MGFQLISGGTGSGNTNIIMYAELSREAQSKLLSFVNISNPSQNNWDVLPLAYTHSKLDFDNQDEIDDEALCQAGYYN